MRTAALLSISALTGLAAASPITTLEGRQAACQSVHVFIARGSTEPYPGGQGALATAICSGVTSCGYEDITYPATFENYCASAGAGVSNGIAQITAYANRCPNAKLVLTGYSQGGHVVGDILGGGGGSFQGCTQATNTALNPASGPGAKSKSLSNRRTSSLPPDYRLQWAKLGGLQLPRPSSSVM